MLFELSVSSIKDIDLTDKKLNQLLKKKVDELSSYANWNFAKEIDKSKYCAVSYCTITRSWKFVKRTNATKGIR